MGEIAINQINNIHDKYREVIYINPYRYKVTTPPVTANVFIGGVASTINTPALLASKLEYYPSGLSFNEADIQNFTINGSDIECLITVDYALKSQSFENNTEIYSYVDNVYCKKINGASFRNADNFKKGIFPEVINVGDSCFYSLNGYLAIDLLYLPKCTSLGSSVLSNDVFRSNNTFVKTIGKFYFHPSLATINSGSPDGDIQGLTNQVPNIIRYVANYTAPQAVTDLAISETYGTAVKLTWSAPSSTNTIDYYEIYVNGVLNNVSYKNFGYAYNLVNGNTYTIIIKVVDIYYNKSINSNSVNALINGADTIPYWLIQSYYNFNNNVLDSVGVNNGTAYNITYETGKSGNAIRLNNTSSYVDLNTNLLLGGKTNISLVCAFKMNVNDGNNVIYGSWTNPLTTILRTNSGSLQWYTYSSSNGQIGGTFTAFTDTTSFHILVCTYDGTTMRMYLDGTLLPTTFSQTGVVNFGGETEKWGRERTNYGNHTIDCGGIFNKALTQTEVTAITDRINSGLELI